MQTWPGFTGSGVSGACRVVTFQPLSCTSQLMKAPTASGSDRSMAIAEMLRRPYGRGTGSATTDGCPPACSRLGDSGM